MNTTTNQLAIFNQQTVDDFNKHKQNTNQLNYEFNQEIECTVICPYHYDHEGTGLGPFKTDVDESEDWRDANWSHSIREALLPNHPEGCVTLDN